MPNRSSKTKRAKKRAPAKRRKEQDVNVTAFQIVSQATSGGGGEAKNPHAVALGRLGGLKGGVARRESVSPERRSEIASQAARARWRAKKPTRPK